MKKDDTISRLIMLMKEAGVDRNTALNASLRLRHPGMTEQMIEWMEQNKTAPPVEICKKSKEISKK